MIVIIPIGGIGKRFKDSGYKEPKALINVCGKQIISFLLDNLNTNNIDYILIPYNKEYSKYGFEDFLIKNYPNINFKFLCLEKNTKGAAETINILLNKIISEQIKYPINMIQQKEMFDKPILCLDSDNFYLCDIINKWNGENCVFTFKDICKNPIYSYIKTNNKNMIVDIKEKEKISNEAFCGAYGFKSYYELYDYTNKIIKNNITQKSEFYTSGVIKEMINDGKSFKNINILNKNYFSLGTPEQVNQYEHPFIFDLDGTLVDTDNIYVKVWDFIMKKYNLSVDENFFKFFIQGKNDILFLKKIFPKIKDNEINDISILKDNLFIQYLDNYDKNIMIDGAENFIKRNKNRRMCIVTNCNKKAAEYILKKTNLNNYIQFLITSEDCNKHKPNKEPYERAINILKCGNNCTIFEDSNSGYKSAKSNGNTNICLILNNNSSEFILNSNEYKIRNYDNFDLSNFNNNNKDDKYNIKKLILLNLNNMPIKDVIFDNIDMKTGYICDIKSLRLVLNDKIENIVIKIENYDNDLSIVARKINLYKNEVNFYEKIVK